MFFRSLHFVKSNASYTLRSTDISYTRTREVVLHAFPQLGYSTKIFGLHSLRAGGATAAANAGVNDRLFKLFIVYCFVCQKVNKSNKI